jgi:hypothetical protein
MSQKGRVQEFLFVAEALSRGYEVYLPAASDSPTDLMVGRKKVQLKTMTYRSDRGQYLDCRRSRVPGDAHFGETYLAKDVDVFACKLRDSDLWALVPFEQVGGRRTVTLPQDSPFWDNWSVFDDTSGPRPAVGQVA